MYANRRQWLASLRRQCFVRRRMVPERPVRNLFPQVEVSGQIGPLEKVNKWLENTESSCPSINDGDSGYEVFNTGLKELDVSHVSTLEVEPPRNILSAPITFPSAAKTFPLSAHTTHETEGLDTKPSTAANSSSITDCELPKKKMCFSQDSPNPQSRTLLSPGLILSETNPQVCITTPDNMISNSNPCNAKMCKKSLESSVSPRENLSSVSAVFVTSKSAKKLDFNQALERRAPECSLPSANTPHDPVLSETNLDYGETFAKNRKSRSESPMTVYSSTITDFESLNKGMSMSKDLPKSLGLTAFQTNHTDSLTQTEPQEVATLDNTMASSKPGSAKMSENTMESSVSAKENLPCVSAVKVISKSSETYFSQSLKKKAVEDSMSLLEVSLDPVLSVTCESPERLELGETYGDFHVEPDSIQRSEATMQNIFMDTDPLCTDTFITPLCDTIYLDEVNNNNSEIIVSTSVQNGLSLNGVTVHQGLIVGGEEVEDVVTEQVRPASSIHEDHQLSESDEGSTTVYETENPKQKTRKRQKTPSTWKKNVAKQRRCAGEAYVNAKGVAFPAKTMGPGCKQDCRNKCHEKVNQAERLQMFKSFHNKNDSFEKTWEYIRRHVHRNIKTETKVEDSRRTYSYTYNFTVGGKFVKVCKTMFLKTFCISNSVITTAYEKLNPEGTISPCKVGKHDKRGNAIKPSVKDSVREHIRKFPKVESHYIRKDSSREYIEEGWSVAKMHRSYIKWMEAKLKVASTPSAAGTSQGEEYIIPVDAQSDVTSDNDLCDDENCSDGDDDGGGSENQVPEPQVKNPDLASYKLYLEIFNNEFNISHHKPKKDQCELCSQYKHGSLEEKAALQEKFDNHIKLKNALRAMKEKDRLDTEGNAALAFCCFDLQKVLYVPQGNSSGFYYNSKLATYDFTVFETRRLTSRKGYCFTWHEGICQKGSNEIASCLLRYFHLACKDGVREFRLYCDNCTGQNKNRQIFALLTYASALFGVKITLTFLLKGHTQNEGDNMHANIELCSKGKKLFLPSHWRKVMRAAVVKKEDKYKVLKLNQSNCLDFKDLVSKQNWKCDVNGVDVKWLDIRQVVVEDGVNLKIKYDITKEDEITLCVNQRRARPLVAKNYKFKQAYNEKLPISASARKGILKMCEDATIPSKYQGFYRKLLAEHQSK